MTTQLIACGLFVLVLIGGFDSPSAMVETLCNTDTKCTIVSDYFDTANIVDDTLHLIDDECDTDIECFNEYGY